MQGESRELQVEVLGPSEKQCWPVLAEATSSTISIAQSGSIIISQETDFREFNGKSKHATVHEH